MRALDQDAVAFACVPSHPVASGGTALAQLRAGGFGQHARALAIEHANGIENLGCAAADAAVGLLGKLAELGHLTEHRKQATVTRALGHRLEFGEHGFGARLVCLIDDRVARSSPHLLEPMLDRYLLKRLRAIFKGYP